MHARGGVRVRECSECSACVQGEGTQPGEGAQPGITDPPPPGAWPRSYYGHAIGMRSQAQGTRPPPQALMHVTHRGMASLRTCVSEEDASMPPGKAPLCLLMIVCVPNPLGHRIVRPHKPTPHIQIALCCTRARAPNNIAWMPYHVRAFAQLETWPSPPPANKTHAHGALTMPLPPHTPAHKPQAHGAPIMATSVRCRNMRAGRPHPPCPNHTCMHGPLHPPTPCMAPSSWYCWNTRGAVASLPGCNAEPEGPSAPPCRVSSNEPTSEWYGKARLRPLLPSSMSPISPEGYRTAGNNATRI